MKRSVNINGDDMALGNTYIKKDDAEVLEETIRGYIYEFFLMQKYNTLLKRSLYANTDSFVLYI